ncbi:MAG: DUF4446 family protein [Microgenomates group bacterium]
MSNFYILILILNCIWLSYLTFLIYKKVLKSSQIFSTPPLVAGHFKLQLVRYNPFNDVGGDQSFILCLLDKTNSGVIITSLHTRDSTRVYAKAIKNGSCDSLTLSKEETKALIKTVNS